MEFPEWLKLGIAGGAAWLGKSGLDYFRAFINAKNETTKTESEVSIEQRKMDLEEIAFFREAFTEDFQRFRDEISRLNEKTEKLIREAERNSTALKQADDRVEWLEKENAKLRKRVKHLEDLYENKE